MAKYVYPAILQKYEDGSYCVKFPDLEGCYTQGENLQDALEMAEDALSLMLYDMEMDNKEIPKPTDLNEIKTNEYVTLVMCDTMEYRKKYNNKSVKKTLSIPLWLNTEAEKEGINFSKVLQDALISILNIAKWIFFYILLIVRL